MLKILGMFCLSYGDLRFHIGNWFFPEWWYHREIFFLGDDYFNATHCSYWLNTVIINMPLKNPFEVNW